MNSVHVILGAGPLGRSVMRSLLRRDLPVRMVNRSGSGAFPANVETAKADIFTGEGLEAVVKGAAVIYQCANAPYHQWERYFPAMQRNVLEAAKHAGAQVVIGENLYMYGDMNGVPLRESMPYTATTKKGIVRATMATDALSAHEAGDVRVVIGRGSDFFGPEVTDSMLGERQIGFAVKGKKASLTGNIDVPHAFTYIYDFGEALAELAHHPEAFGRAWHVPTASAWTQRQIIEQVYRILGVAPSYSAMGKTMMRIGGLFVPAARETVEMMYEFEKPFLVDSSAYEDAFRVVPTPMEKALSDTVRWFQSEWKG